MPALPTITSDFLSTIKSSLSVGSDLATPGSGNIRGAAMNYLRAQDMSSALELLQDALDLPAVLTATGGTASSVQDTAAFVAGSQLGNYVVFTGNTTAALAGVSARVTSNTVNELFFASLPATPVVGDTYTIVGGMVSEAIADLREGKGPGDSPAGSVYGEMRIVTDALIRLIIQLGGTLRERNLGRPNLETVAGSTDTVINLATLGVDFRIDEFRGAKCTIAGESRIVVRNTENSLTLNAPLGSGAPAAATAVAITVAADLPHNKYGMSVTHPGPQPGENIFLADMIDQAQAAVVAFTLPT